MHSDDDMQILNGWQTLAKNAGWIYTFESICFICDRPSEIHRDTDGRLHNPAGMAMKFRDGYGLYAWHGVRIPANVIEAPDSVSLSDVLQERNAEVRRAMMEALGEERLFNGIQPVQTDSYGELYRLSIDGDENYVAVRVLNSTLEPDGSRKVYWLRVPPHMQSAHQAVAWTFGMSEAEYHPLVET